MKKRDAGAKGKTPVRQVRQKPERLLYHYTTQEGLPGILEKQRIRAMHLRHLNDAGERHFALN